MTVLQVAGVSHVAWVDHGSAHAVKRVASRGSGHPLTHMVTAHPDGVCHRPSDRQRRCVQHRSLGGETTLPTLSRVAEVLFPISRTRGSVRQSVCWRDALTARLSEQLGTCKLQARPSSAR